VAMHLQLNLWRVGLALAGLLCTLQLHALGASSPAQDGHQWREHFCTQLTGDVLSVHCRGDADHVGHGGCRDKGLATLAVLQAFSSPSSRQAAPEYVD
jgi:hypothetical protein